MKTTTVHGVSFYVLENRSALTLRKGDVIRTDISPMGTSGVVFQYLTVMDDRSDIRATRRRRGLPFHRTTSVEITVRGFNGDFVDEPVAVEVKYYIQWPARFFAVGGARSGWVNFQRESVLSDDRFTVFRRVTEVEL